MGQMVSRICDPSPLAGVAEAAEGRIGSVPSCETFIWLCPAVHPAIFPFSRSTPSEAAVRRPLCAAARTAKLRMRWADFLAKRLCLAGQFQALLKRLCLAGCDVLAFLGLDSRARSDTSRLLMPAGWILGHF